MTIGNVKQVGQKRTGIKRITILEEDGTEAIINVSEVIHFIFGFAKSDRNNPSEENPMELMVFGDNEVLGEIFYQTGEANPSLIDYCVRKQTARMAGKIIEEIKKSGVDPIAEAMKKMPPPSERKGWN